MRRYDSTATSAPSTIDSLVHCRLGRVAAVVGAIAAALICVPAAHAAPYPFGAAEVSPVTSAGGHAPSWAPDSRTIAFSTSSGIDVSQRDGSDRHSLPLSGSPMFESPAFSPDGSKIAYSSLLMSTWWVIVADADGSHPVQVAAGIDPAWSPDGTRLVYASSDGSTTRLRIVNADGSGDAPVGGPAGSQTSPDWSPDGGTIAYTYNADLGVDSDRVHLIGPDGTRDRALTPPSGTAVAASPTWSPDGTYIAFTAHFGPNPAGIYVSEAAGGPWVRLQPSTGELDGYLDPDWSPDGNAIAFMGGGLYQKLYVMDLDLALAAQGVAIAATQRSSFSGTVATFTDADPKSGAGDFSAEIAWGDGSSSAGTVVKTAAGFAVQGAHTYAQAGPFSATITISDRGGALAVAHSATQVGFVGPVPPRGPVGVSIDGGARFTNSPHVTLSVVWPAGTESATVSNDGGFAVRGVFPVARSLPWTIDSSGPERLPKTVYLRFDGSPLTFQDDIILDETAPVVRSATVRGDASVARHTFVVHVKARDKTSGLRSVQITANRHEPGRDRPYRSAVKVRSGSARLWVRVRDRAGNRSAWRRARR